MRTLSSCLVLALLPLGLATLSSPARACGGTFCDGATTVPGPSGPIVMSVDQRGENILFVLDGTSVEAHIQIQYQGDAAHFAWVIPVQTIPAFGIGSQALFDRLLGATVPTYGYTVTQACSGKGVGSTGAGGGASTGAGGSGGGPSVVYHAAVGAFEIHVLSGGTADEVQQWLAANGYAPSPDAPPILQQYLEQGYLFAALKLQNGVGVDQIHPIVIKVPGNKPCVPLRLTRVAAVENMTVRAFFLGKSRAVPTNYKHVTLNPLRLDFLSFASDYDDAVAKAIDAPVADGHAFVTEYAGASSVAYLAPPTWDAAPFELIAPEDVVDELATQGLATCAGSTCNYAHPLLQGILHQFLPVPAGLAEGTFYASLSTYKDLIDLEAWDAAAFAGAFDERIVQPAKHATSILDDHPYLTRLLTVISPAEMTEDPEFTLRSDLGDVATQHTGSLVNACGCSTMKLPDGRVVSVGNGWPAWGADMPYAERIEDMSVDGPPIALVDASSKIATILAAREAQVGCQNGASGGGPGGVGPGGKGVGGGPYGNQTPAFQSDTGGSSCAIGGRSSVPGWIVAAVLAGLLARRRRNDEVGHRDPRSCRAVPRASIPTRRF